MRTILLILLLAICTESISYSSPEQVNRNNKASISAPELSAMMGKSSKFVYYDLRTYLEYSIVHIPKSINLPMQYLKNRMDEINGHNEIVLLANDEKEAALASQMIKSRYPGKTVRFLSGGINSWINAGYPIQNEIPHGC
ncbi:rhodanese-like domain-containing protein [Seleniivibrio sp.]|uniref:rhodanese-like domain-containing protein n=1 Tax=Seleniivibrio sp. TaxID=2898801 RepID=UPI0025EB2452|nr:rhodanese-like domain-containing protein [Seleniivibrio sp.]MCD8553486.1 rhodanese-like domain-containing protein [Seleniivibrio sp.]